MNHHPFVLLAQNAIATYIETGATPSPPSPLPEAMKEAGGVFVSLKKIGALRGCVGTTRPTQENLAKEIIRNAVAAASRDPRFSPVTKEELPLLKMSVDVLTKPSIIQSVDELDPKQYGIIVSKEGKQGVLLPDLPEIDTVYRQVILAAQKAGINDLRGATIYKFRATRYY